MGSAGAWRVGIVTVALAAAGCADPVTPAAFEEAWTPAPDIPTRAV